MALLHILVLATIISAAILCNVTALIFIRKNNSFTTLKDKIIIILCINNILLVVPFSIELYAHVQNHISETNCQINAFLVCCLTYTCIGYFVELAMERCISTSYLNTGHVDCISSFMLLLLPPIIGFMLASSPLLGWGKYGKSRPESLYCGFDFLATNGDFSARSYFIVVTMVVLIIPLIISSACFLRLIKKLRSRSAISKDQRVRRYSLVNAREATKSFLLTTLVYFISWIPFAVYCFMAYFNFHVPVVFEYVAMYVSKTVTISSPVISVLMEKQLTRFLWTKTMSTKS